MLDAILIVSCKKNNNDSSAKLALIQHKWMIVSINGEALRYVGMADDYYNFGTDGFLYMYINKSYDTSSYALLSDNSTLLLYPIMNGVKSNVASSYNIKVLTNNQFVIGSSNTITHSLDSLKR